MKRIYGVIAATGLVLAANMATAQMADDLSTMTPQQREQGIKDIQANLQKMPPDQREQVKAKMIAGLNDRAKTATPEQQGEIRDMINAINTSPSPGSTSGGR